MSGDLTAFLPRLSYSPTDPSLLELFGTASLAGDGQSLLSVLKCKSGSF